MITTAAAAGRSAPGPARRRARRVALVLIALALGGCQPGGQSGGLAVGGSDGGCTGSCASPTTFLTVADVTTILDQAAAEAAARGTANATIAVTDRVGNVLGIIRRGGAVNVTITSGTPPTGLGATGGLDGQAVPDYLAAISKAITAAYLSSEGDAFSSRTANQIIQEHFDPGELGQPGGPLFGVQFSQLPCGDMVTQSVATGAAGTMFGPKRAPLGLAADSGGLPLYKGGTPVGAIGAITDGIYGLDRNISDIDSPDTDEFVALAGTVGFEAPANRRADQITVNGLTLRFSDATTSGLVTAPASAPAFAASGFALVAADGKYFNGAIIAGTAFGQAQASVAAANYSGIVPAASTNAFTGQAGFAAQDGFVLADNTNANRFPPIAGTNAGTKLTQAEVVQILTSALQVANRARAQIRRPQGSQARVTISVVDTTGTVLGIVRARDAPVFGTDVSLQKARTAAFFSSTTATSPGVAPATALTNAGFGSYVTAVQSAAHLDAGGVAPGPGTLPLTNGIAFGDRAGGNMSRPFFPDGVDGQPNGPFSRPYGPGAGHWSPFNVGLQLDLVQTNLLAAAAGAPFGITDCTPAGIGGRLKNGIQIFPGSVPIYKGSTLVGGIGVSGDGVDQDDMVSFLGLYNAGQILGTVNNAPANIRADHVVVTEGTQSANLRFVQCPFAPFLDSNEANPCDGK